MVEQPTNSTHKEAELEASLLSPASRGGASIPHGPPPPLIALSRGAEPAFFRLLVRGVWTKSSPRGGAIAQPTLISPIRSEPGFNSTLWS